MFDATRCPYPIGCGGWFVSWVCVGGFSVKGTPGPVPIPVAKFDCADGTAIVGLWESKTPPTHITSYLHIYVCVGCVGSSFGGFDTPHIWHALKKKGSWLLCYWPTSRLSGGEVSYLLLACVLLSNASDVEKRQDL